MRTLAVWPLTATLFIAACGDSDDHGNGFGPSDEDPPESEPRIPFHRLPSPTDAFTPEACWFDEPDSYAVQCGYVAVPENRGSERTIELAMARFFSSNSDTAEAPVVYLEGGPGGFALNTVVGLFADFESLLQDRDLVVVDQRGTGLSEPSLHCPEADELGLLSADEFALAYPDALRDCRSRLTKAGIDLGAYTSKTNAADIDAVRRALGYEQWHLYGISYGTRLALTILRDHPAGVRSVVLDSVLPLQIDLYAVTAANAKRSFDLVFSACEADAQCAEAYPDLPARLTAVLDDYDAEPEELTVEGEPMEITGNDLLGVSFLLLYDSAAIGLLPAFISLLEVRDTEILEALAVEATTLGVSLGMYLSVTCSEEIAFTTPDQVLEGAAGLDAHFQEYFADLSIFEDCEIWDVPAAPAVENREVVSDVPTLVMAGEFDPITPPGFAQLVAGDLSHAQYVELPYVSHGSSISSCGQRLRNRFLRAPEQEVATLCISTIPKPEFLIEKPVRLPRVDWALDTPSVEEFLDRAERALRRRGRARRAWP